MKRQHFHTFDALRFFSFLLVFLLHLPKTGNDYIDFFLKSGGIGVSFFFVLSGFLITYILLFEKRFKKKISLKNFFLRRILRIWPLFYLMIAFAYLSPYVLIFFGFPYENEGYSPDLLVSLFFCENYKMIITDTFPNGAPLRVMWSLCVEEHFYILWGVAFYFISEKKIPLLIISSVIIANITRGIYTHFEIAHIDIFSQLDYFAFGAVPAYFLMYKKAWVAYVSKVSLHLKYIFLVLTVAVIFILPNVDLGEFEYLYSSMLGVLFSVNILFTLGENPIHISDDLWFSKLGIYTYGLYLYHTIVILLFMKVFKYLAISNWYLLGGVSLLLTIIVSMMSYHFFEKHFLKFKKYFR